jgi:hypothetical protein
MRTTIDSVFASGFDGMRGHGAEGTPMRRRHAPTTRYVATVTVAALVGVGCGQIVRVDERTDRRVEHAAPTELHPTGDLSANGFKLTADRLHVRIDRVRLCQPATQESVTYQKVKEVTTEYDVGSFVIGLGLLGGGAGLLASRDDFSDKHTTDKDGNEEGSDRELATVVGVLGLLAGAWSAGQGLMVMSQSGDHDLPEPGHAVEVVRPGRATECGRADAEPGDLVVLGSDGVVGSFPALPPGIDADLRAHAEDLCQSSPGHTGTYEVYFVTGPEPGRGEAPRRFTEVPTPTRVRLGPWDPGPCRVAFATRTLEAGAAALLESGSPVAERLAGSGESLASARHLLAGLAAGDRDRAALVGELDRLTGIVQTQATAALDGALQAYRAALAGGELRTVLSAARGAFAAAPFVPGRADAAFVEVYRGLGANEVPVPLAVSLLSALWKDVDPATGACARGGTDCTTFADGAAVVAGARLLSEKAEALRALRIARTAASWRAIFPGCVRVQALAAASRQISRCDANCQRAQAMAKAEYDALRSFTVKNGELGPATLGDLRGACAAAGCPVCP